MVLDKAKTKSGIDLVLWNFDYGNTHFYSVMAYPIAQQTDYASNFGARRGEKFCIDISFSTLEECKKAFNQLKEGTKTIMDFKNNVRNKEDLDFI